MSLTRHPLNTERNSQISSFTVFYTKPKKQRHIQQKWAKCCELRDFVPKFTNIANWMLKILNIAATITTSGPHKSQRLQTLFATKFKFPTVPFFQWCNPNASHCHFFTYHISNKSYSALSCYKQLSLHMPMLLETFMSICSSEHVSYADADIEGICLAKQWIVYVGNQIQLRFYGCKPWQPVIVLNFTSKYG